MPQYHCYRGDVDNIAITESGSFLATDSLGRTWVCHEVETLSDPTQAAFQAAFGAAIAQHASSKTGNSTAGTDVIFIDCDLPNLAAHLSKAS